MIHCERKSFNSISLLVFFRCFAMSKKLFSTIASRLNEDVKLSFVRLVVIRNGRISELEGWTSTLTKTTPLTRIRGLIKVF